MIVLLAHIFVRMKNVMHFCVILSTFTRFILLQTFRLLLTRKRAILFVEFMLYKMECSVLPLALVVNKYICTVLFILMVYYAIHKVFKCFVLYFKKASYQSLNIFYGLKFTEMSE